MPDMIEEKREISIGCTVDGSVVLMAITNDWSFPILILRNWAAFEKFVDQINAFRKLETIKHQYGDSAHA